MFPSVKWKKKSVIHSSYSCWGGKLIKSCQLFITLPYIQVCLLVRPSFLQNFIVNTKLSHRPLLYSWCQPYFLPSPFCMSLSNKTYLGYFTLRKIAGKSAFLAFILEASFRWCSNEQGEAVFWRPVRIFLKSFFISNISFLSTTSGHWSSLLYAPTWQTKKEFPWKLASH